MNKNSNSYIVCYATVMVVVVATLLAVAALSLQSRQRANMLGEKQNDILRSLGAEGETYDSYVEAYAVGADGERLAGVSKDEALEMLFDLKSHFDQQCYPVFEARDGKVVLPVTGSGLWGPIWGYIALEKDMNTVAGVVFDHQGETPGLGAEIATPKHWARYVGKTIFEGSELRSIKLRKGGATPGDMHEVDAISGGTKTSDGVTAMLYDCLTDYLPLLKQRIAAQTAPETEEAAETEPELSNEENTEGNE